MNLSPEMASRLITGLEQSLATAPLDGEACNQALADMYRKDAGQDPTKPRPMPGPRNPGRPNRRRPPARPLPKLRSNADYFGSYAAALMLDYQITARSNVARAELVFKREIVLLKNNLGMTFRLDARPSNTAAYATCTRDHSEIEIGLDLAIRIAKAIPGA